MNDLADRISVNKDICHGQPCVKGTRVMVYLILELLEAGVTKQQIITDYYPQLSMEDVDACIRYATTLIRDAEYVPF
ncbi:MAG: DUF433 domain-containing protein [Fimbriimonadia bacterium]|nr:DUF433 domain-containing protein [Fimbriimonadia bacterium]